MNNLITFENFVNEFKDPIERMTRSISKTFKPGKVGDIVKNIIFDVKINFDLNNLKLNNLHQYEYITSKGDILTSNKGFLKINDEVLTGPGMLKVVNKHFIEDLYDFLDKKYKEPRIKKDVDRADKISKDFRIKYANKY